MWARLRCNPVRARPRWGTGVVAGALAAALAVVALSGCAATSRPTAPPAQRTASVRPEAYAVAVLHSWDARREAAWTSADPAALGDLYAPGSSARSRDLAALAAWRKAHVHLRALCTQVLGVRVLRLSAGVLVLRVADRLCGGRALTTKRSVSVRPGPVRHYRITMTQVPAAPDQAAGWRVAAIRELSRARKR